MARLRSGILGNIRGKVAGVVGSQWKDQNVLREFVKPANPNTAAQQAQRSLMSGCVAFCKALVGPVFNAYTDKFQKSMSGFNFFIKRSIVEFDGSPVYANLKLTEGKLYLGGITAAPYQDGVDQIQFTYSTAVGNNGAADDKIYAAVYHVPTELWYFAAAEVTRSAGTINVDVPDGMTGTDFECWLWAAQYSGSIVSLLSDSDHAQATIP